MELLNVKNETKITYANMAHATVNSIPMNVQAELEFVLGNLSKMKFLLDDFTFYRC